MSELPSDLMQAVAVLRRGGLVGFPTETVYGLGADALLPQAVKRIFAAKGRPSTHPLIVHLRDGEDLGEWASRVPQAAHRCAEAFWPGPLTMLLARSPRVSDAVTGGRETVGLRVPAHPVALALLEAFGGGLVAPSANRFGRVSPTTAAHVRAELGANVDLVLDGGACAVGVESTIVDLSGNHPVVLRPGGVTLDALEAVLGEPVSVWEGQGPVRAPGMLESHYAPRARVVLSSAADVPARCAALVSEGRTVGVLAPSALASVPVGTIELDPAGDPDRYAKCLYARLREADQRGVHVLVVVPPPGQGVGLAVLDRLRRAAS